MGEKSMKKQIAFLLSLFLICGHMADVFASGIEEELEEVSIECVAACMPDVNIYCYPQQPELLDDISITYGGDELKKTQVLPYLQSGQGSDYYMLLDVSASVSPEYFAGMKAGILDFWQNMTPQDKISLITFGDDVELVFQNMTMADDISEQVNGLENTDQTTHLFDAVQRTAKLADSNEEAGIRKIAVVLTDGEDFSENSSTKDEALGTLNEKRIPLYAMGAKEIYGSENTFLDSMGEFVRSTGGQMAIFDAETAVPKMQELHQHFLEAFVIMARAKTNVVDYQKKALNLRCSNEETYTVDYTASYYSKDEQPPVASLERASEYALRVKFSEPVRKADQTASYEVEFEDSKITDGYMVRYDEGDDITATVTFEEKLRNGEYTIRFHGITDDSMETNELKKSVSLTITNGMEPGIADFIKEYQVFLVGLAVLIVLLAALGIGWQMIKKRSGVVMVEGKAVLKSNLEKKHRVEVKKVDAPKKQLQFYLEGAAGKRQINVEVGKSIIVGRSQKCDLSINDEKMSRQHFAITNHINEGVFYIEDLHTTNGTLVNGTQISSPVRLNAGDTIKVGDVAMTVRW